MFKKEIIRSTGVSKSAAADENKKSISENVLSIYPDKNPDNPAAEDKIKEA